LTSATKFQYIEAIVIRLDDGRQRATFPQWCDIASNRYCSKHASIVAYRHIRLNMIDYEEIHKYSRKSEKMAHKQNRWIEERDTNWNSIQIVHPGEVFPLLHLAKNGTTARIDDNGSFAGIASRIRLQTRQFDTLNISIAAAPYALQRGAVVAPFERHKGYPLDQEDFSLQSRMKKIARMKNELTEI